ncbi:MAG: TrbI F-type domain-containing protein [Halobacteriovoraceae bacterium]|nr:TrbI F-type domain-containing protein [Halobacteriovoraceae bacterium]
MNKLFITIVASVAVYTAALLTIVFKNTNTSTFGVIQVDKVITGHINKYAKLQLSDKERLNNTKLFSKILSRTLNNIQENENVVLLTKPAVVSNLKDYTFEVISKVNKEFEYEISK